MFMDLELSLGQKIMQNNLNLSTFTTIADKLYFSEHLRPVVDLLRGRQAT